MELLRCAMNINSQLTLKTFKKQWNITNKLNIYYMLKIKHKNNGYSQ